MISASRKSDVRNAASDSIALSLAALAAYLLTTSTLSFMSASRNDVLLGGLWGTVATVFVFRFAVAATVAAAVQRITATIVSFALCELYLISFPFNPFGLAVLIAAGTFILLGMRRPDAVVLTSITTTVVMVAVAIDGTDAWKQPLLRLVDTAIGTFVAFSALSLQPKRLRAGPAQTRQQ
jgi:uncharacterized membrane protein YccC